MNLTYKYRPKTFDEVVGQEFAKSILKGIVKDPKNAPRAYVFHGPYGTGKTTLARIFAKAMNGQSKDANIIESPYYFEFDSSMVGNVDVIRELRETLGHSYAKGFKIVVYDEAHTITSAAQSALLKPLEEPNTNIFYLFTTTEVDKLLKTIRSRAIEIEFRLVSKSEVVRNLKSVCTREEREVPEEVFDVISSRASGHVRDSLMLLDKYLIIGEDQFLDNVFLLMDSFETLFQRVLDQGMAGIKEGIISIVKNPLTYVKEDLENFMMKQMFMHHTHRGIFSNLKYPELLQVFSYFIQNKNAAFHSSSDTFSFLFLLCKRVGGHSGA